MRVALETGGDPNGVDAAGWRPAHCAARSRSAQVAVLILEAGAEVDAVDGRGNMPLWRAVSNCRGDPQVLAVLRTAGADADRCHAHGVSPRLPAERIANDDVAVHLAT